MKIKIRPCICTKESVPDNSAYYGMPQLKVTDCNDSSDTQYYESFCPACGRGGCGFQCKSAYLALKHWNEMQERLWDAEKWSQSLLN